MFFTRNILLPARLLPAVVRRTSRLPRPADQGSTCLLVPTLPARKFSISSIFPTGNVKRYAVGSSLEYPSVAVAKTTRRDTEVKPGTEFTYHRIPGCLIPHGWTNDPFELEASLGLNLHYHYSSFPQAFSPVLSYMGVVASAACLVSEGSPLDPDFYLITFDDQVFRLDTAIELLPLLVWMREQIMTLMERNGGMHVGLESLLEHPELEWVQLRQDEWMERCTHATS